jgi:2-polyprenyl-3-methyl-5-hydroxy-6-metoxy-1,4-benzoquinol methylase
VYASLTPAAADALALSRGNPKQSDGEQLTTYGSAGIAGIGEEDSMNELELGLMKSELEEVFRLQHGDPATCGWGPRMRLRFGYFTPDVFYEAFVAKCINDNVAWLDVGCGRNLFPSNQRLAQILAERCGLLVGLDPDDTIDENQFVHRRVKSQITDYCSDQTFDVVTLRMVAEHLTDPGAAVSSLARLTRPGGKVVVLTINKVSPVSIAAMIIPHWLHHTIKRVLWKTEERDTFPVRYRMNTKKKMVELFEGRGFRLLDFAYLADCRIFSRFRLLHFLELSMWRFCRCFNWMYPENCLLAVFERIESRDLNAVSTRSQEDREGCSNQEHPLSPSGVDHQ